MKIDDFIQSSFQNEHHRAIVNLRYTFNYLSAEHNKFMSQFGLTMPQFNILRILRGAKGDHITVNTVKQRMIEKSPNTTRLMDKLIEKELIQRIRCTSDRRVVYISITDQGLSLLDEIDASCDSDRFLPKSLSAEEAQQLSDLLDKLRG